MEPLNTITVYFPFIDDDTKRVLISTMDEAYNYSDFARLLVEKVCTEETTDLSVYFAAYHSSALYDTKILDRIAKQFGKLPLIRPILFIERAFGEQSSDLEKALEAANVVINDDPSDWLKMEMLMNKLDAEIMGYPKYLYDDSTLVKITTMLDEHKEFDFYKTRVYSLLRHKSERDGDMEEAARLLSLATQAAKKLNDPYWLSRIYQQHAECLQARDLIQSAEYLHKSREILENLGDKNGVVYVLQEQCRIMAIRGEYDQAIESSHELVAMIQKHGRPVSVASLVLSTLYNVVGNPEAGLEWAKLAEADIMPIHRPRARLNKAWSLALMGDVDEAFKIINDNREEILKSGLESHLAGLYLISGVAESLIGNYSESMSSIQSALDIYERRDTLMSVFISLVQLAKIDLERAMSEDSAEVGPWIENLKERGQTLGCPGIIAQALYLKTLWLRYQGLLEDARNVTKQLRVLVNDYSLAYLESSVEKI